MKLKLRIPTLDGLSAEQKALYRAMDGGGFILDHEADPDGYGIDNLAAIRGKLAEKERDYDRANQRLQGFKKADGSLYTVEELQVIAGQNTEFAKTIETLKDKTKTNDQQLQELVAAAKRPLEAEVAKLKAKNESSTARALKAEKSKVVDRALEILKPMDEWKGLMRSEIERLIEMREAEDGTVTHVVLDPESGRPRMSSLTGRDGPMDVAELAGGADLRKRFGQCLRGDGKKGADVTTPADGGRGGPRQTGADIVLPAGYTQQQFETAFAAAKAQGGQVAFTEEAGQPS